MKARWGKVGAKLAQGGGKVRARSRQGQCKNGKVICKVTSRSEPRGLFAELGGAEVARACSHVVGTVEQVVCKTTARSVFSTEC